jgi:transposase-like protein
MKEKGRKGLLGKAPVFEESFKIAVAREYLTGQLSYRQLATKHNLTSGDTARYFVSWYKAWREKQELSGEQTAPVNKGYDADLEQQLKQANLRITALEMLIKNAEQELGIDIVKKSGTKRHGK